MHCSKIQSLLDHLVGSAQQREREGEAERLGGLEVNDQPDLRDLLDRKVGRLLALEDSAGVDADLTMNFRKIASVTHEAASRSELTKREDCRNRAAKRCYGELFAPASEECIGADHQPARSLLQQGRENDVE